MGAEWNGGGALENEKYQEDKCERERNLRIPSHIVIYVVIDVDHKEHIKEFENQTARPSPDFPCSLESHMGPIQIVLLNTLKI